MNDVNNVQCWILPTSEALGVKLSILNSWLWTSNLFITSILISFYFNQKLYSVIGKNCIRFKNHQFCEFGQLWRLPQGEQCKIWSLSFRCKLFKISFVTTFIPNKTLYNQIWNIYVRFVISFNFSNLENFDDFCGEKDASSKVYHQDQCCLKWHFWQLLFRT